MLDTFLAGMCLDSAFLSATSACFKWGCCAMKSVQQKRPSNQGFQPFTRVWLL